MTKVLPVAVALVVIAVGTYFQGKYSERWGKNRSEKLAEFSARLANVPTVIGDWEGTDQQIDPRQFKASNCDACVSRDYSNRRTGETVSVFLVSGTGRHVTIHTPDWCYRGAGYDMDKPAIAYSLGEAESAETVTTTFTKQEPTGTERLRIFWCYTDDGVWVSPKAPELKYGAHPALYKVYLITTAKLRADTPEDSPVIEFAKEFFPVLNAVLFPAESSDSVAAAAPRQ